ncbi:MAG TPA: Trm112 family protein [Pirellulaceae bacterium]|nr:Trm112 family protein [Pirellulaceae bacterium]
MNITVDILPLLQCPITRQRLIKAEPEVLDRANGMIDDRKLTNRLGETVEEFLEDGLIDREGKWLYAVRDGIVCLLADEAIPLDRLGNKQDEATT